MKKYVLGFIICTEMKTVLLIEKIKPAFQNGYLNGIGGKVEQGEDLIDAMVRETKEECDLDIPSVNWTPFCTMICKEGSTDGISDSWSIACFIVNISANQYFASKQMEKEVIQSLPLASVHVANKQLLGNTSWLVGMGIDALKNKAFYPPIIQYTGLSLPFKL